MGKEGGEQNARVAKLTDHQSWVQGSDSQLPAAWHWHCKACRLNRLDFPLQITTTQVRKNGTNCLLRILIHQDVTRYQTAQHIFLLLSNTFQELSSFKATICISKPESLQCRSGKGWHCSSGEHWIHSSFWRH